MATKNYFPSDHKDSLGRYPTPSPSQRLGAFGYTYNTWYGENIAAGYPDVQNTLTQWKNSAPHNANLLNSNYTVIGLAHAYNGSSTYHDYWTNDFGGYVDATVPGTGDTTPPTVSFTASPNSVITNNQVTFTTTAADVGGVVTRVEFYNGTSLIAQSSTAPFTANWTPTVAGNYSITAKAYDNSGNVGNSINPVSVSVTDPVSQDTTPPVRSGSLPNGILNASTTQVTLRLNTNEPATCKYGTTPNLSFGAQASTFTTTGNTTHQSTIAVTAGSSYAFYVRCQDAAGNANTDDYSISFSIAALPVQDTTPPTVSAPSVNPASLVSTNVTPVTFSVTATDSQTGISKVEFYYTLNGSTNFIGNGFPGNFNSYNYSWVPPYVSGSTSQLVAGNYSIFAKAYDGATPANNATSGSASLSVTNPAPVNQKPTGSFDAVRTTDGVAYGWAQDPDHTATSTTVHIYIDAQAGSGSPVAVVTAGDYRSDVGWHAFNYTIPNTYRNGVAHTMYVYAIDLDDLTGASNVLLAGSPKSFTLTPPASPPTGTISFPATSVTAGGSLVLSWSTQNATNVTLNTGGGPTCPVAVGSGSCTLTFSTVGTYTYSLSLSGNGGSGTSNSIQITVTAATPPPSGTASIILTPNSGSMNRTGSVSYSVVLGDKPTSTSGVAVTLSVPGYLNYSITNRNNTSANKITFDTDCVAKPATCWSVARTITLTYKPDATDYLGTLIIGHSGGSVDARYAGLSASYTLTMVAVGAGDTQAPVVSMSALPTTLTAGSFITLNATATDDVGVTRVELYQVFQGTTTQLASLTGTSYSYGLTLSQSGTYNFYAKAYDASGKVGTSATQTVTVGSSSPAPTANLGVTSLATTQTTLTQGGSTNVVWSTTDTNSASLNGSVGAPTCPIVPLAAGSCGLTFNSPGVYTYTLAATGNGGSVTSNSITITVNASTSILPTATLSGPSAAITAGGSTALSWTLSNAVSATLTATNGGPTCAVSASVTSGSCTLTFPTAGSFVYTLMVSNSTGGSATSNTVTVTVNPASPPPTSTLNKIVILANPFPFQGTEGTQISYSIKLKNQPTSNVYITLGQDPQFSNKRTIGGATTFIISPSTWNTPTGAVINIYDDTLTQGNRTLTVSYAMSVPAGGDQNFVGTETVPLTIIDNDSLSSAVAPFAALILPDSLSIGKAAKVSAVVESVNKIKQVEFFVNGKKMFTDYKAPFYFTYRPTKSGTPNIQAKVTDSTGQVGYSAETTIAVAESLVKPTVAGARTNKPSNR